jgi:hypothetical protein
MSVRCPKCRKKHDEPYPKRCGCGQSLVTLLAARRENGAGFAPEPAPRVVPAAPVRVTLPEGRTSVEPAGNEW